MEFDRITAVVRPRNPWEAADLGILMARAWWGPIIRVWLAITLPVFLLLNIVFYSNPLIAIGIFWWFKPIWERPILHILSRTLFGELPSFRQTLREFPKEAWRQMFSSLLWRRFSATRSMDLPVIQLENLEHKARSKRLKILHNTMNNSAFWLTFICVNIEAVLEVGILFLVILFIPEGMSFDWEGFVDTEYGAYLLLQNIIIYIAISLVTPFYVACGFSLYINRRILLEAWDVEIGFRRLRHRLQNIKTSIKATVLLFAVFLVGISPVETVMAGEPVKKINQETSSHSIKEILKDEDFHQIETNRVLKWFDDLKKEEDEEDTGNIYPEWLFALVLWLARSLEFILWATVIVLILVFAHKYRHWLAKYLPESSNKSLEESKQPQMLFGMAVGKESLPENVIKEVEKLWNKKDYRAALGLLYRAALTNLMETHGVNFHKSHTEGECIRLASAKVTPELSQYFADITRLWCSMAYAHILPTDANINSVCNRWEENFQSVSNES